MSKMIDLTGQRFGRLTVIRPTEERYISSVVWECRCDCGNLCRVPSYWLRHGIKHSCGCLQDESRRDDITGQTRGRLTAIRPTDQRSNGATIWEWRCSCGAMVYKSIRAVGDTASTMCPACARKLKREQAEAMRGRVERDEDTGVALGYLPGIRAGKLHSNNTSGVRGVTWHAGTGKWMARVEENGKTRTIGYFSTIEEAAKARAAAVKRIYGAKEEHHND